MPRIFTYGSLLADVPGEPWVLGGWRRTWGCAMDNAASANDDKHWIDPQTQERPAVAVAYAAIEVAVGERCAGALITVEDAELEAFDTRERHYVRTALGDDTWTYVPTEAAAARAAGRVVLCRAYTSKILIGLDRHGHPRQLPMPTGPVRDLLRVPPA